MAGYPLLYFPSAISWCLGCRTSGGLINVTISLSLYPEMIRILYCNHFLIASLKHHRYNSIHEYTAPKDAGSHF